MTIEDIDVDAAINSVKELLKKEQGLSPALKSALEVLLLLVSVLLKRVTLNSRNSSKPPSTDPNRKKSNKKGQSNRKPGGQKGHSGTTLEPVDDPDKVCRDAQDAKRDIPVPLSPSLVTTAYCAPAALRPCRIRLHMPFAGYRTSFFRHSGHTPAPTPRSPWRAAVVKP